MSERLAVIKKNINRLIEMVMSFVIKYERLITRPHIPSMTGYITGMDEPQFLHLPSEKKYPKNGISDIIAIVFLQFSQNDLGEISEISRHILYCSTPVREPKEAPIKKRVQRIISSIKITMRAFCKENKYIPVISYSNLQKKQIIINHTIT